jgi:phage terminase large subunit-like protein
VKAWSTACPDWERRILARESLIPRPPLFPDEAEAAMEVFRDLRIVDAPGSPTIGEACRPWIFDFAASVFGAYDHQTGRRLMTEFMLLVSKKNTKSTIAAGIMLTALIRNWRQSAEYLIIAPTIEIANNSFFPARDMVRSSEELSDLFHVQEHYRTITHRGTKATLKVVAADNDTVSGKKATGILVDELWLFGKRPHAENMFREATGGLASRPEGFIIYLTTQADEPPAGVMKQKLDYARGVRDGRIQDKRFLPVLYEFPDRMISAGEHREKRNFYVTNPNLGLSVDEEFLEREFDKAVEAGEASMRGFLAKHLNVEIGLALGAGSWAGAEMWEAAGDRALSFDELLARCEVIVAGIDGGGADDLFGLAFIGRERETRRWLHWGKCWGQRIVLQRRKALAAQLLDYERSGELTFVDEPGPEVDEAADLIARVDEEGLLGGVGLDPMGIGEVVDALAERGIEGTDRVKGVPQGWKLSAAIKTLERKLANGTFAHAGQPIMAWNVGNAKVEARGNAVAIDKAAAGSAKIDLLAATLNAAVLMSLNPEGSGGPSVYETRDMLVI